MTEQPSSNNLIELDTGKPVWPHFFTVAPLIVIGTKEEKGYDLAPKHMATPLGHSNYFGFVCTPRHSTYHNVMREKVFTVSFPRPDQVVLASLAASPRCGEDQQTKPIIQGLPTVSAPKVDALFVKDSYLFLECELDRIVDGFEDFSLICGRIIAAYVAEDSLRVSEKDEQEMIYRSPLLAYLAHGRFAEIRETYAFPLPKGFRV